MYEQSFISRMVPCDTRMFLVCCGARYYFINFLYHLIHRLLCYYDERKILASLRVQFYLCSLLFFNVLKKKCCCYYNQDYLQRPQIKILTLFLHCSINNIIHLNQQLGLYKVCPATARPTLNKSKYTTKSYYWT